MRNNVGNIKLSTWQQCFPQLFLNSKLLQKGMQQLLCWRRLLVTQRYNNSVEQVLARAALFVGGKDIETRSLYAYVFMFAEVFKSFF